MISIDDSSSKTTMEIDRLSFSSMDEFRARMYQCRTSDTKSSIDFGPQASLMSSCSDIDYQNDPILRYDLRDYKPTKADGDVTVYEAAGYEEYIPDENLATLLNARGEVEIGGVIYKISKTGTYYFDKKLEAVFIDSYAAFEECEGEKVDTLVYKLSDGIYRYATFELEDYQIYYDSEYYDEPDLEEDVEALDGRILESEPASLASTKSLPPMYSYLAAINWADYPRYCSDAKTWAGKIIQSLFGRNKAFDYKFTNKRKFQSKFYYYDYLFWSSIGVSTKMLKKQFLGWKQMEVSEIFNGWGNIIIEIDMKGHAPKMPEGMWPAATTIKNYNDVTKKDEVVAVVLGLNITESQLLSGLKSGFESLASIVYRQTHSNIAAADRVFIMYPNKIFLIFPPNGEYVTKTSKNNCIFCEDYSLSFSLDLLNLPSGWIKWLKAIGFSTWNLPNVKLVSGEVRTAVNYDGRVGAMSIYKK
ncbi:hypothetical protein SAMN06298215_1365 [Bacteroidales bacterium WCE2008]|nr:hypothetical protein SAMN06298215_1365 [Bacteroidales bacterium WCE2008]